MKRASRALPARRAPPDLPVRRARKRPQGPQGETGPQGEQGIQGPQGEAGESAYTAASKGGYTGTETQFNSDLAKIGNKADKTAPAAAGNLAALDAAGNLSDSGKRPADFQAKVTASGLLKWRRRRRRDRGGGRHGLLRPQGHGDGHAAGVRLDGQRSALCVHAGHRRGDGHQLPGAGAGGEHHGGAAGSALQAANITDAGQAAGTMTLKRLR